MGDPSLLVPEGLPDRIVVIDRDRIIDPHVLRSSADVVYVLLEWKLRIGHTVDQNDLPKPAGVSGGELSHSVAPAREGISPSTGNFDAAGAPLSAAKAAIGAPLALVSIAASMSLFAFMMTPGRQHVSQLISREY
jgi:hypothetical protein